MVFEERRQITVLWSPMFKKHFHSWPVQSCFRRVFVFFELFFSNQLSKPIADIYFGTSKKIDATVRSTTTTSKAGMHTTASTYCSWRLPPTTACDEDQSSSILLMSLSVESKSRKRKTPCDWWRFLRWHPSKTANTCYWLPSEWRDDSEWTWPCPWRGRKTRTNHTKRISQLLRGWLHEHARFDKSHAFLEDFQNPIFTSNPTTMLAWLAGSQTQNASSNGQCHG